MYPMPSAMPVSRSREVEISTLSQRQFAILAWIAYGKTTVEICRIMGIGRNTVEREQRAIQSVLNVNSRIAAAAVMIESWRALHAVR